MIIDIPTYYQMTVKMPRGRVTRDVHVTGTHVVEIPEVADAIPVAEIDADGWLEREDGTLPKLKVYMIDGEFWATTYLSDRGEHAETPMTAEVLKHMASQAGLQSPGLPSLGKVAPLWTEPYASEEAVGAKTIVSSERDAVLAAQTEAALRLRVHDGMILRKVSEPVYQIRWLRGAEELHIRHRFLDSILSEQGSVATSADRFIWRLDQFEMMVAEMDNFHTATNRGELEPALVHRPDLLTWDRHAAMLISHFNRDLEYFTEKHAFKEDNLEQFAAYIALRDHGPLKKDATREEMAEAIRLVETLCATHGDPASDRLFSQAKAAHVELVEADAHMEATMALAARAI